MKRIASLIILLTSSLGLLSFMSCNITTDSDKNSLQENELILGEFKLKDFKATNNKKWFEDRYEAYSLKPEVVKEIASMTEDEDFKITVYMGTWCEDSQREFPVFIKLLDQIEFNFNNLTLVGVDEDKIVPNLSEKEREKLNVFNVPTIIVYDKNGKEVNRFVEFPQQTLEEDLLKIFSGEDYKHVYDF
jgi:thiol-disulfide isomerase/thioredoxin